LHETAEFAVKMMLNVCRGKRAMKKTKIAVARTRRPPAVPRQITADAVRHYTGMRVDTDAISYVEEM